MTTKLTTALLFSLVFCHTVTVAQQTNIRGKHPLRLSLFSQHVSLPAINRLINGFNPGIMVGTERYYTMKKNIHILQSLDVGYAHHGSLDKAFFATSEFCIRPKADRFFAELKLGPGLMLSHSKNPVFRYEENSWAQTAGWQQKFLVSTGVGIGYTGKDLAVILSWKCLLETPYLVHESAVLPRQLLAAGFQIAL